MSEHLGKSAEMVVTADSDVRNKQPAVRQKAVKPNPARWVAQGDGSYRWWSGHQWTDAFTSDPSSPDPTNANEKAQVAELEATTEPNSAAVDPVAQLKQLAELRDAGILTEDEFAAKKAEILKRM